MEESVSDFIVETCRMLPKPETYMFDFRLSQSSISSTKHTVFCGSCVEFLILPFRSCIGDVDFLQTESRALVFTDKKPVLPYDFRHDADTIECYFMEPYHNYPAFVRLVSLGRIRYNFERNAFEYIKAEVHTIIKSDHLDYNRPKRNTKVWLRSGPARIMPIDIVNLHTVDVVASMWCPQWPKEAKYWPVRQRNHGWPTTVIIHEVVQNGCHVVSAKHPACKDDENQCRLSFSVAEVILIQSWNAIQQLVYHMLRFFAKKELIKKDCHKEDEVLCSYHLKTLMLWSCEELQPDWWDSFSVIELCCSLFGKLLNWLKEKSCPNYFIPQANLFQENFNKTRFDETVKILIEYCNSTTLSIWFVVHYINPRRHIFFHPKEWSCDAIACSVYWHKLQICETTKAKAPKYLDLQFSVRFLLDLNREHVKEKKEVDCIFRDVFKYSLRNCSNLDKICDDHSSAEIETCYRPYESMLRILYAIRLLDCEEIDSDSEWFAETIRRVSIKPKRVRSKHHNLPRPLCTGVHNSISYFINAQDLMEHLIELGYNPDFQALSEMSKRFLLKALNCEDSNSDIIGMAALSYLAALHFAASKYQVAIDLCSRVIMNEIPEKEHAETLNAGCLLYIEDISQIVGFYLVFRKTKDTSLHYTKRPLFLDMRLTPEVFARYLTITSIIKGADENSGLHNTLQAPKFLLDSILMAITNRNFSRISKTKKNFSRVYQRIDTMNKLEKANEDAFVEMLLKYSLDKMSLFYHLLWHFDINCNTFNCYRAAYLYKCRDYPKVLLECERILDKPDLQRNLKQLAFANVMVLPPLDSYFDNDIQCMLGLHTLVYYLLPSNKDLLKMKDRTASSFQHYFAKDIYFENELLAECLMRDYSLKCNYFLRRHFLARYLKVRCLIDCNHSHPEVMGEFMKLKARLPFEHIIGCFLRKKLQQPQKLVEI